MRTALHLHALQPSEGAWEPWTGQPQRGPPLRQICAWPSQPSSGSAQGARLSAGGLYRRLSLHHGPSRRSCLVCLLRAAPPACSRSSGLWWPSTTSTLHGRCGKGCVAHHGGLTCPAWLSRLQGRGRSFTDASAMLSSWGLAACCRCCTGLTAQALPSTRWRAISWWHHHERKTLWSWHEHRERHG